MKTYSLKYGILLFGLLLISGVSRAQDALWQLDFDKEIAWNKITESGILLIGTNDFKLHGVDSRDGNKLWSNDILNSAKNVKGDDGKKIDAAVAFERFVSILEDPEYPEVSDFIEIKYSDATGMYKNYAIINMQNGKEVMSPEIAEMPITKWLGKEMPTFNYNATGYIPELRMVIISAAWQDYMQKGKPWLQITKMVELPSAKVIWEDTNISCENFPFVLENGDIIMPGKTRIARINAKTGKVIWDYNTEHKNQTFESFDLSLDLSTGYFFEKKKNSGALSAVDMKSGKKLWEQEMKLKEVPAMSAMGYGVVVNDGSNFELYDLNSGTKKWRVKKVDGTVIDLGDHGIAVTQKTKRLVLLDKNTGDVIWDEKINGINIDQIIANGIMYSDIKGRLGLIQYDGTKTWDKKGMLEVPSVRYRPEMGTELMYIDGDLYEVDLFSGDYKVLVPKLDKQFEGDEVPERIELVDGGYLVSSSQNMIMLETDGSIRWKEYWEAPGMSLAAKIALRVSQAAMIAMAAGTAMESAQHRSAYGGETYYSKMYAQQSEDFSKAAGMLADEAKKLFTASISRGSIRMVLSRVGAGGQAKSAGIVKVDKNTGEELATLLLGDKEPIYDYDPLSGQVFFKADKKQIISYSL
ncbi:PQQ-binding-like beta-propeller repeat protein [Reichenbachiella carrageenanivorans]|uniref:PQQ-binding-like beta-propeller repeat protein n=1 Tax=Reichenbachiella carrageenanivorans TaxID=2979869 RepID=A0ABY6D1C5_9BACT|nr:PQQ-binding-like beta-propeller repeat protein [Reichenbachiella carrageenanivorans]UXX79719.1 PQQ-binding-like beta-propeller repeat protein [Reichenbachiella carrageenanivorans]